MTTPFKYFEEHASNELFDIVECAKIFDVQTLSAFKNVFKQFIENVLNMKTNAKISQTKAFAMNIHQRQYDVLFDSKLIDYYVEKNKVITRSMTKESSSQVLMYNASVTSSLVNELFEEDDDNKDNNDDKDKLRSNREYNISTQMENAKDDSDSSYTYESSQNSSSACSTTPAKVKLFYLNTFEDYTFKLEDDSLRWSLDGVDVSAQFIKYRNECIKKAEKIEELNECEQLALDGILLIDNDFYKHSIFNYDLATSIMNNLNEDDLFQVDQLTNIEQDFLQKFAANMRKRVVDNDKIEQDIFEWKQTFGNEATKTTSKVLSYYASTDSINYSTDVVNEATLVRDTIDHLFKAFFANNNMYSCLGADVMIQDSNNRFTDLDPSLKNCGKRADYSIVSVKNNHLLYSLEAKSHKTKHVSELVKLSKELKDSLKSINSEGYTDIVLTGTIMRGNCCDLYTFDHPFDGIYRMILLDRFYVPKDRYQLILLSTVIPVFQKLKLIVNQTAIKLMDPPLPNTRIPLQVATMHSPMTTNRRIRRRINRKSSAVKMARRRLNFTQ